MRPSVPVWLMGMAKHAALRSTCLRRSVGCVLVNERDQILSTGYNGVPSGFKHCNEGVLEGTMDWAGVSYPNKCSGADAPSGEKLDACNAVHAEQNALLQCPNVYEIKTAYVTASPCMHCIKLLLNTSCEVIVFDEEYTHCEAKTMWIDSGRTWLNINDLDENVDTNM